MFKASPSNFLLWTKSFSKFKSFLTRFSRDSVSYSSGSWRRDYHASWSLCSSSATTSFPQIMDLKMFFLPSLFFVYYIFRFLRTRNSFWNFNHVLDNKFIWISGFELFGIIGGDSLWDDVCAREKKRNIKISSACMPKLRVASNVPTILLSFHFLSSFFPDARKSRNEKSTLILYAVFLFRYVELRSHKRMNERTE